MGMLNIRIVNGFHSVYTYVKLKDPATPSSVERAIKKHACSQPDCKCETYFMLCDNDPCPSPIARWDRIAGKWDYEWKWGKW